MTAPGQTANRIMQYAFLVAFANDGTIDADELAFMQKVALEDGHVDEHERRVLGAIFSRVTAETVAPEVWAEIGRFKSEHGIE